MNVDRCVALHNEILTIGWESRGRDTEDLGQSWFEFYGGDADEVRERLSPHLVAFLERAWEVGDDHSFFYYVAGLNPPTGFFPDPENHRFLTLYAANDIAEHPVGLKYDQQTNTAIIEMTVEDGSTTENGRQRWYPLETVLEAWRDMIRVGKIRAVGDDVEGEIHKFDPWIIVPYSEAMLQESITAFDELVGAIESRTPDAPGGPRATGLVDEDVLQESGIPAGFAYEFIQKVKRPRFKYIAPGLMVPTATSLPDQPFFVMEPEPPNGDDGEVLGIQPILLFRSHQNYSAPPNSPITGSGLPFSWPYSQVSQYLAGLYLGPVERQSNNPFEDESKLVLPFGIGSRGFARTSDGARFGENTEAPDVEPRDTFDTLYQPGYQPFGEIHGVRLVNILKSWTQMVERGDWSVDQEGIVGGMEEWKKADTEEHWEKFLVPVGW
ncbi:hypothetical protein BCR34DRAFT_480356 [Clohesyomyces aquaticus]|uniref:Uncharacterized protein n=1 Tax=Clohesyomyces aquaticus TaxID=1231657 RepID=A0A1Y1ZUA2_9PLEO|nr:hypothetical protein BCR34DRAFT_480356 [Clohesyomyces aquaticus]